MNKYHINPNTGMPGVCYAQPGNCPYGDENHHYTSYEEAQDISFQMMENQYPLFEEVDDDFITENYEEVDEIESYLENSIALEQEYDYLNDIDEESALDEVYITNDKDLLDGILSQHIVIGDEETSDKFIYAAIQNENAPRMWVDDAIQNPNNYDKDFMKALCKRSSLTEEELFTVAQRTKSPMVRDAALGSRNITVGSIIANLGEDGMAEAPELALHLGKNPNCPPHIRQAANQRLVQLRSDRMKAKKAQSRG